MSAHVQAGIVALCAGLATMDKTVSLEAAVAILLTAAFIAFGILLVNRTLDRWERRG